jgi:hypothetical protein
MPEMITVDIEPEFIDKALDAWVHRYAGGDMGRS